MDNSTQTNFGELINYLTQLAEFKFMRDEFYSEEKNTYVIPNEFIEVWINDLEQDLEETFKKALYNVKDDGTLNISFYFDTDEPDIEEFTIKRYLDSLWNEMKYIYMNSKIDVKTTDSGALKSISTIDVTLTPPKGMFFEQKE